jgi:hypothetical protein
MGRPVLEGAPVNLGVLLLYCNDNPRVTTFTRNWAEAAVQSVADYVFAQSAGRESVSFKVFDWYELDMTSAEWLALGMGAGAAVRPKVADALDVDLDPYTHILIGIDVPGASGGTTPGVYTYLAARNFTPQMICHELGHRFGADDAWGDTPMGPQRYQNAWDVMGARGFPATFTVPALVDSAAPGLGQAGPGMTAPSLVTTGWLDPQQQGAMLDLTGSGSIFMAGGVAAELSALTGAPGPGWTRPPVAIRYFDKFIEYRVRAANGWDRGIPDPGPDASGWVVAQRSDTGEATLMNTMKAVAGNTLVLGTDDPLDLFHDGPLRITVLSADAAGNTVRLSLQRRAAQTPPHSTGAPSTVSSRHPGVVVWTPGTGTVHVPTHSVLVPILTTLATVSTLHDAQLVATSEEAEVISQCTARAIEELQGQLSRLPAMPTRSPLAEALERVSELRDSSERNGSSYDAREFVNLSRQRLVDVERTLRDAVMAERGAAPA